MSNLPFIEPAAAQEFSVESKKQLFTTKYEFFKVLSMMK